MDFSSSDMSFNFFNSFYIILKKNYLSIKLALFSRMDAYDKNRVDK